MISRRVLLLVGILVISLILAFFMRDVVYATIIVPLAYVFWLGKFYYSAIPQFILWVILLAVIFITVVWNFLPETRSSQRKQLKSKPAEGQIKTLSEWILKSHKSNYFKWQLANRLGKISRKLAESSGDQLRLNPRNEAVDRYLDAGINYSFVDFPSPKNRFQHPGPTPLDLDPKGIVDFLESQMEQSRGRHP